MMRTLLASSVVVVALVGSYAPRITAADQKVVRGTVASVAADTVAITAGSQQMKFTVDANTHVEATGAGTKSRAAQAAGKSGVTLSEVVKPGQAVEISYEEANGSMHAMRIRAISRVAAVDPAGATRADGKVTAVSATSLTIAGSSGPAKFNQTYSVDAKTRVIGKGVGTAVAAKGGRSAITDLIAVGDSVSVSYRTAGDMLHATEVRVMK